MNLLISKISEHSEKCPSLFQRCQGNVLSRKMLDPAFPIMQFKSISSRLVNTHVLQTLHLQFVIQAFC